MMKFHKCSDKTSTKEIQKTIKNQRKKLKNEYNKGLADNINTASEARDAEKEFAMAKTFTTFKEEQQTSNIK